MAYFVKENDGNFYYSYCGVADSIDGEYVSPELIDAYLEDEVFWNAVKSSYKKINLSGRNKRDMERFAAKHKKTADWLRKRANAIYF